MTYKVEAHPLASYIDQPVDVHFGGDVLPGRVVQVYNKTDGRDIKVLFDDPLVYGGMGAGWFKADQVSRPGQKGPILP
jgi:hypothetical protein